MCFIQTAWEIKKIKFSKKRREGLNEASGAISSP